MSFRAPAALKAGEHLLVGLVFAGATLLLTAGYWLQSADSPAPGDVMVTLMGDYERPFRAAELHRLGMAKKIYVGRSYRRAGQRLLDQNMVPYPREEEVYRAALLKMGVPAEDVEFYGHELRSTAQEAETLAARLADRPPGRLLVVTSPAHVFRARKIFSDAFPGWEVRVDAASEQRFPLAWWTDQDAARNVFLELPKIVYYLLGGRFRSAPTPG